MSVSSITCVLFHGPSGSGKSSVAYALGSAEGLTKVEKFGDKKLIWEHKALSTPLLKLHSARCYTKGENEVDRMLWLVDDVLHNLVPPQSMSYEDFIELIYDVVSFPINPTENEQGQLVRDRNFFTGVADLIHSRVPDGKAFARALAKEISASHSYNKVEYPNEDLQEIFIVSDLRLRPEYEFFKMMLDPITIQFKVSPETQARRMVERDGRVLTEEQKQHATQISPFKDEEFDLTIDTDNMSVEEQTELVRNYILNHI